MSEHTPGRPPRGRRWCVPPAAAREPHQHLPGIEILVELGREPGLLLWLLLRDVELWADTPAASRTALFHSLDPFRGAEATLRPQIAAEVNAIVAMLGRATPGAGPDACGHIAEWAQSSAPGTALLFAQAAALLDPASAERARGVAARALQCEQPLRAESWLRRAVALARRQRDWTTYAEAYADLGEVHEARAEHDAAGDAFQRVLRACRRHSLPRTLRARALVAFLRAALREGRSEAASRLKRAVLRATRPGHPGAAVVYIALASALAASGRHSDVLAVLPRALPTDGTAAERFELARLLVRSAGALDDSAPREQAWEEAVSLLQGAGGTADFARLLARLADDLRDAPGEPLRLPGEAVQSVPSRRPGDSE